MPKLSKFAQEKPPKQEQPTKGTQGQTLRNRRQTSKLRIEGGIWENRCLTQFWVYLFAKFSFLPGLYRSCFVWEEKRAKARRLTQFCEQVVKQTQYIYIVIIDITDLGSAEGGYPGFVAIFSDFPRFSSNLFRFPLLVFGNIPICSDLLRCVFQNKSEQIRETPFYRPLSQVPNNYTGQRFNLAKIGRNCRYWELTHRVKVKVWDLATRPGRGVLRPKTAEMPTKEECNKTTIGFITGIEHFRERVRGSNFAVRVLCAFLIASNSTQQWLLIKGNIPWGKKNAQNKRAIKFRFCCLGFLKHLDPPFPILWQMQICKVPLR